MIVIKNKYNIYQKKIKYMGSSCKKGNVTIQPDLMK